MINFSSRNLIYISLILLAFLFLIMPATMLWDWDEPLYARTGIEMFERGDFMTPRFNGETFTHKPPLGYWLMGLSAQVFGETEFGVRFFSAPTIILSALLAFSTGREMFGVSVGGLSFLIFGTSLMTLYLGTAAMMDGVLLLGMMLSMWAVIKLLYCSDLKPLRCCYLLLIFGIGMLITLFVKGPVGPVLTGLTVLGIWVALPSKQRPSFMVFWGLVVAGLFSLAIFMFWFIPVNQMSQGKMISEGVLIHIVGRALSPMEGHGGIGILGYLLFFPIYIPVIALFFMPWTFYLPLLFSRFAARFANNRKEWTILGIWFLTTFIVFSLAATKLPHYIFPVFPPLAIAIATCISKGPLSPCLGLLGLSMLSLFYLLIGSVIIWIGLTFVAPKHIMLIVIFAGFIIISFVVWIVFRRKSLTLPYELAIGSLVVTFALFWGVLSLLEPSIKVSKEIGNAINLEVGSDEKVYMLGYYEPSLVFYASRGLDNPIEKITFSHFEILSEEDALAYVVVTEPNRLALMEQYGEKNFTQIMKRSAYNFNNNGVLEIVSLVKWTKFEP